MSNILVIGNSTLLVDFVSKLQEGFSQGVTVVDDFSTGLRTLFESSPDVVFIQEDHLQEQAGSVAAEIRTLVGYSIGIYLLRLEPDMLPGEFSSNFDGCLDLTRPVEQQLGQVLKALQSKLNADPLQGQPTPDPVASLQLDDLYTALDLLPEPGDPPAEQATVDMVSPFTSSFDTGAFPEGDNPFLTTGQDTFELAGTTEVDFSEDYPGQLQKADSLDSLVEGHGFPGEAHDPFSIPEPVDLKPPAARPTEAVSSRLHAQFAIPNPLKAGPVLETVPPSPDTGVGPASGTPAGVYPSQVEQDSPLSAEAPASVPDGGADVQFVQKRTVSPVAIVVITLLLLTVVSLVVYSFIASPPGKKIATKAPPAVVSPSVKQDPLPSFIPAATADQAYAGAHPGWERYETAGDTYLVFREQGRLKAVQVIAGAPGAITPEFVRRCVKEIAGDETYEVTGWEDRGKYSVGRSTLHNHVELALYRETGEGALLGFVITKP